MTRTTLVALACVIAATMTSSGQIAAQPAEPVRYTVRFPAPHSHYMEVEAVYPTAGRQAVDLFMAVWTPGSYLVREYERHVENVTARGAGGRATNVAKTAKNRWRVETGGAAAVIVNYRVYGREMTVRNNWIDAGFAMLNGAPSFISLVGGLARPHEVRLELASGWTTSSTAMTTVDGQPHTYRAEDFDTLVDSPIIVGNSVIREFQVAGKRHFLVLEGDTRFFDVDTGVKDVQKMVEAGGQVMDRYDYPHYHVLYVVTDAGGGLEHKNSFLGLTGRYTTRTRRAYLGWLGLTAHEYFHNWNVKRLRPIELGPFDYENEVYTKALWIAEGFTDYYAGLLVKRPGLSTRDEYFEELSGQIEAVQTTPGRLVASATSASFDTWIKQYRPDENTANTSINYYPKGAVIAFLLDARIRRATNGAKSLDDAMRLAYERYSGPKGYTLEQFYQAMSDTAGTDLGSWFAKTADSTDELDYGEALAWFGLRFGPVDPRDQRAWLGATTRNDAGRLVVSGIRRDTPAIAAGLNVDDEILAIDDVRVRADGLATRLEQYRPGDKVVVLVGRRDRLTRLDVTLGSDPGRPWRIEMDPKATDEQKKRVTAWIGS